MANLANYQKRTAKETFLRQFASELNASESYREEGIQLCEKIRTYLSQVGSSFGVSIASTHYCGSIGKHTDVGEPDFDMVLMINNYRAPFGEVLKFWKANLEKNDQLNIIRSSIKLTRFSIQFKLTNGMEVDMLPASADMTPEQALQAIGKNPQMRRFYSSSLVTKQVAFMKDQDSATHNFVRLVKYWFKTMDISVSGGSSIFECLAVASVLEGWTGNPAKKEVNFVDSFLRVVDKVENLDRLKLSFGKTNSGKNWKVSKVIAGKSAPYLIEPSNRYNDLLHQINTETLEGFKKNGRVMSNRFRQWMNGSTAEFNTDVLFGKVLV